MKHKKGVIPPKAQVPVAVVLSVLFVCVLALRFGGGERDAVAATPNEIPADQPMVSVDDLRTVLARIEARKEDRMTREGSMPELARNPFLAPLEPAVAKVALRPEPVSIELLAPPVPTGPTRADRLRSIELTAICISNGRSIAVIGGEYLAAGDEIAGFMIKAINDGEAVLEDELGLKILRLEGVSE